MAKSERQRESDLKLARQGLLLVAVVVALIVWGGTHSVVASAICAVLAVFALEGLLVIPSLRRRRRLAACGMAEVDAMDWDQFERLVADLFRRGGYRTELTSTYDYGADVLAHGKGEHVAVQVKHSSGPAIGNKAVQQVVAALRYYQATRAVVVTNRRFTQSAINLARANDVELWDRDRLAREMRAVASPPLPHEPQVPAAAPATASQAPPPGWAPPTIVPACPLCGATMVRRHSAYGEFWGCSGYPDCRGMRPL